MSEITTRDVADDVRAARDAIRVDWSAERAAGVESKMRQRGRRRALTRRVGLTALAAVMLVGFGWAGARFSGPVAVTASSVPVAPPSSAAPAHALLLSDGTGVDPLGGTLQVRETNRTDTTTFAALDGVGARFEVVPGRTLRVVVGTLSVESSGAVDVTRTADGAVVSARRGHAIVAWALGSATVDEGETRVLPPAVSAPMPPAPSAVSSAHSTGAGAKWRSLAGAGDYAAAYDDLHAAGPSTVRDVPEELLLAADVARLSGHPSDAIAPLQRVVRDHSSDPRAPLAAFTLGRVELDSLGRPRDAAAAFAQAHALDPNGALADDALAREVEAWSRAGDTSLAHQRAEAYRAQYPSGRNLRSVNAFGGAQ